MMYSAGADSNRHHHHHHPLPLPASASASAPPPSASNTGTSLSVAEVGVIRAMQCVMRPGVQAALPGWRTAVFFGSSSPRHSRAFALVCVLVLYALGCMVRWLSPAGDDECSQDGPHRTPPKTTLYDPRRLQTTLELFAEPSTSLGGAAAEQPKRHHRTEALCRDLLERMIGAPLPKCRPRWLLNPSTRRPLELDMYNAEMRLAFEYDGAQHDHYTPHYHTNAHHFEYRRLLDRLKDDLCREPPPGDGRGGGTMTPSPGRQRACCCCASRGSR